MKKSLLLLSFLFSFIGANAQFTSPNAGMHFTVSDLATAGAATYVGGEYLISQNLTLETTDTLSINTNETLRLSGNVLITIKGTLLINPPDSVKITAFNPSAPFVTLRFEGATRASVLRKTIVEHGQGIRILNAMVTLDSCTVRFNETNANQSSAINISGSNPVITNCRIYRNKNGAIGTPATGGASPVIRNNWIFENLLTPANRSQINLGVGRPETIQITGNTIIGLDNATNNSGGIAVSNLLSGNTKCLIENNTIRKNRYGIAIVGGNIQGYIKRNLIEGNNVNPNAATGGSGINFAQSGSTQNMVVARNIIRDNLWGITIQTGGASVGPGPKPKLGRIGSADTANVGMNQIYNNFNSFTGTLHQWDLYNNTSDSIYAENNMWGTTNLTDIEDHIFDKTDNASHGFVKYQPIFLVVTGTGRPLAANAVSVYPNPASDMVRFSLKDSGNTPITIRIYNSLGQEVKTISSREATVQVNTQTLANGLYTYRIGTSNTVQTGKFLITK